MPGKIHFHLVNAFAPSKHAGNQAAVVLLPPSMAEDEDFMYLTARDFNLSETAFVVPLDQEGTWGLRWWTPQSEVPLCGHATLASAYTLFALHPELQHVAFHTRVSGVLTATRVPKELLGGCIEVEMYLPSLPLDTLHAMPESSESLTRGEVEAAAENCGVQTKDIVNVVDFKFGKNASSIVEIQSSVDITTCKPDFAALKERYPGMIILTQLKGEDGDDTTIQIRSRVFAPGLGIDEDPATGAAHAFLTGYYTQSPVSRRLPQAIRARLEQYASAVMISARQESLRGAAMSCWWTDKGVKIVGRAWEWGQGELSTSA